jgi:hypothetical protein
MRCHELLLGGLLLVSGWGIASAQQEEIAEAETNSVPAAASSRPASPQPASAAALIELELWIVNLSAVTSPDQWDLAQAEVTNREEVAKRVRQLQADKLVTRSRYLKTLTLEGNDTIAQQGSREPRVQAINKTSFGDQMSIIYEHVGSNLMAKTAVDAKRRVLCQLQVEESYLEDSKTPLQRDKEGNATIAPRIQQIEFRGTVACPSGAARVVLASAPEATSNQPSTIIFMAAKLVE